MGGEEEWEGWMGGGGGRVTLILMQAQVNPLFVFLVYSLRVMCCVLFAGKVNISSEHFQQLKFDNLTSFSPASTAVRFPWLPNIQLLLIFLGCY